MKIVLRSLIFLLLIGIIIQVLFLAPQDLGVDANDIGDRSSSSENEEADQIMQGVHLVETSDGKREWELWADRALGFSGKGNWKAEKVRVIFFSDDGLKFHVTGDRGTIRVDSKDMLIEGNVVTRTSNDYLLYTDSMVYNSSGRELNTGDPVRIKGPRDKNDYRMDLTGVGMLVELKSSFMYIHRDVKGVRPLEEDRDLNIKSNKAKLSSKSSEAFFYGDVEMVVDAQTITGPQARLKYGEDQSQLEIIEFIGGTRVSDETKWATSETLNIFVPEKKLVLEGSPRVVQNNDEIQGETIVFLNGGKQVQVLSGTANITDKIRETKF